MSFLWPPMLLSLFVAPLLVLGYLELMRRRAASLAAMGSMRLAGVTPGSRLGRRRHIPPAVFLAAIVLLLAALARPTVAVSLPHQEGTVILAFDVSGSMLADDLEPTRMDAAKAAAVAFVEKQPSTIQVGVVAFSFGGLIVQQPTNVRDDVVAAISRLTTQGGTSVGEGIFTSLRAISEKPIVLDQEALEGDLSGVDIGYFGSAVIVLLSDGEETSQFDPVEMAGLAANAGVRIFPIGIGSPGGTTVEIDGFRVATALNRELLEEIAKVSGGTYFQAEDNEELAEVYDSIDLKLSIDGEDLEVTSLFAAAAVLLLLVGGGLAMRWFGRVP